MQETQQTESIYSETFAKCFIMFGFSNVFSPQQLTVLASILGKIQRAFGMSRQVKAGHSAVVGLCVCVVVFTSFMYIKDTLLKHEKERYRERVPNLPTGYFQKVCQLVG